MIQQQRPMSGSVQTIAILSLGMSLVSQSIAGEVDELRAEVSQLRGRVEKLDNRPAESSLAVKLGGYVQLNAIRDVSSNVAAAGDRDFFFAPDIPLSGTPEAGQKGKTFFSARTSRLYVQASKPSDYGEVKTRIEADFFTGEGSEAQANSARFRLRHAYAQVGKWMFGQYWSTFVDVNSMPDVMDFGGPTGQVFVRQPQIRYTANMADNQTLALALENPNNSSVTNQHTTVPDFIAKYGLNGDWGYVSLAGVVRKLNSDDGQGNKVSKTTGGLSLAGNLKVLGKDTVVYQANGGQGIGRYLSDAGGETAVLVGQKIVTQPARGAFVGYQHPWNADFRSALVLGRTWFKNDSAVFDPETTNRRLTTAHMNLIWTPVKSIDVGLEYIHGKREVESGNSGSGNRVMLALLSSF